MSESELTTVFRNVVRVAENHCTFPADMTAAEKDDLRILASAIFEADFSGNAYDILRDAFTREKARGRKKSGRTLAKEGRGQYGNGSDGGST